ncbi:gliding motility-associated C-terminal domain-containing protein, partial [Maribellus sp. YY47]|uniref:gliding motility-associated C-terminal domain-containing protein n=1 Tax=Maribellus sp. YY47 TaxID=2929486 RepID=UPI0020012A6B
ESAELGCNPEVVAPVFTGSDNCEGEFEPNVTTEGSTNIGCSYSQTWTANYTDACDNPAAPVSITYTWTQDTEDPIVVCKDTTIQLDENGMASITAEYINGGSTDNCGIDTIYVSQYDFTCDNVGPNDVILTVVDNCGNTSSCTATVTVESGAANCVNIEAKPDVLEIVVCKGREVAGSMNILANDNLLDGNINLSVENLPQGVQLDMTTGDLTYYSETITESIIEFTYTICHNVYTNDCSEALVTINVLIDTDCDSIPDVTDIDDDDDGILDIHENQNALNQETLDSDGDGIPDRLDIDSDNDGIPDNIEWQQTTAEGIQYAENGGVDAGYDYYPPLGTDSNQDGWDDQYDDLGVYYTPVDMDMDGIPDYLDDDSDGDGIADYIEGWDLTPHDTIADVDFAGTDIDGDGLDDAYDSYNTITEWLHGLNAIGSNAPLQDSDSIIGVRDWRDDYAPVPPQPPIAASIIFIPNGFSPNTDGFNDYFQIVMKDEFGTIHDIFGETYPDAKIEIFNRWGNKVFGKSNYGNYAKWNDQDAWWDGTSTNDLQVGKDKLPTATYFYILYLGDGNDPITGSIFLNN